MHGSMVLHGLKDERQRLRLSIRVLADLANVGRGTVYRADQGFPILPHHAELINAALEKVQTEYSTGVRKTFATLKAELIERKKEQGPNSIRQVSSEQSGPSTDQLLRSMGVE